MGNGSQIRLLFKLVSSQFAATWPGAGGLIYGHKGSRRKIKTETRNQRDEHKLVEVSCYLKFGASWPAPPVNDQKPALLSFVSSQGNNEPSTEATSSGNAGLRLMFLIFHFN